jgi:pimeloyl-ACP methyl ester carboxylesterase
VLHTVLRHPARVLAAVLADYGSGSADAARFRAAMAETAEAFLAHGSAWTFEHRLAENEIVAGLGARRKRARDGMRRLVEGQNAEAMAYTIRGILTNRPSVRELEPELRRIGCPVLVIRGALDRGVAEASSILTGAIPDVREVVIPEVGHVTNILAPGPFNRALRDFLERSSRADSGG